MRRDGKDEAAAAFGFSAQPFDYAGFCERFASVARRQGLEPTRLAQVGEDDVLLWRRPSRSREGLGTVYISAGIHGDEPAGPLAALAFLERGDLDSSFEWVIVPALNPVGLRRNSRENGDGIDLNRDFLRLRSAETRALADWWERSRSEGNLLHLSLHEDWEASGFYFYAINTSHRECFAKTLRRNLELALSLQAEGPVDGHPLDAPGLIIHPAKADDPTGWPEAIWLATRQPTLSYTFEAPSFAIPLTDRVNGLVHCLHLSIGHAAVVLR